MLQGPWRIELFGGLRAVQGDRVITRFRTEKTGVLLAYLAVHRERSFSREELIELLWPEADIDHGRMSLRTALSSLRRQLEPPGTAAFGVLAADPSQVRLNPAAIQTDVAEFERALESASEAQEDAERARLTATAAALYRGELLSGYYDDWIVPERERLAASHLEALRRLIRHHAQARELSRALGYAHAALQIDSLNEDLHRDVARLYLALGRPQAAAGQLEVLSRILRDELGRPPSEATRQLSEELTRRLSAAAPTRPAAPSTRDTAESTPDKPWSPEISAAAEYRLPVRFTRFFGRTDEMARLRELLGPEAEGHRLHTLTGPGGTGKTRLALEIADSLAVEYGGAVWFVPLEELMDGGLIPGAIADNLGLQRSPSTPTLDLVAGALAKRPSLLVLDNFEQVVDSGASVVLALLSRARSLRCLVTSRRRLGLSGEREIPLAPLPIPKAELDPEPMMRVPSVQLYVDRAQAVRPDFQVTRGNADAVARLCGLLEGMPLALELAAARAQVLTPAQIADGLSERFEVLAGRRGEKSHRHRSLWAAIDWSFRLLSPELQSFFAQLSVFRGGWSVDAAESVTGEMRALEYLTQLRNHSLVLAEDAGEEIRFRMLDSIRDFASAQLAAEQCAATESRHTRYFAVIASDAWRQYSGGAQAPLFARLEREHDNLRALLRRELERNPAQAMYTAADLSRFWNAHGHYQEGRAFLEKALEHPINVRPEGYESRHARAWALSGVGSLAWSQGDLEQARRYQEESLRDFRELGDRKAVAFVLLWLANVSYHREDFVTAEAHYRESLLTFRETGDLEGIAYSLVWLGNIDARRGKFETAGNLYREVLNATCESGDKQLASYALNGLGYVAFKEERFTESQQFHRECLLIKKELGDRLGIAGSLEHLAFLACAQERFEDSVELSSAATALRESLGAPLPTMVAREFEEMTSRNRERLTEKRFHECILHGRSLGIEEAIELALSGTDVGLKSDSARTVLRPDDSFAQGRV